MNAHPSLLAPQGTAAPRHSLSPLLRACRRAGGALALASHSTTAVLGVATLLPAVAWAQPAAALQNYDIPAGALSDVVAEFAAVSGVQLVFAPQLLADLTSPGLRGRFDVSEGFSRLLAGSGMQAVATAPRRYRLERTAVDATSSLPPVTVSAGAVTASGDLAPAYAGGQMARGGRVGILGGRDMMDTPFNQASYTAQLLQDQQVRLVAEALDNDPSAQSTNASTGHDGFSIRGFHLGNGLALFNGLPNIVSGTLSSVPAESFERVEVLKGPNSLISGNVGKVGGMLNLVPKRAGEQPLTELTMDYGARSQAGAHLDIGRRFGEAGELGVRVNGVHREGDTGVDRQSRRTSLATLGLDYRGKGWKLEADLGQQHLKVQGSRRITRMAAGVPVPVAPQSSSNWFDPAEYIDADLQYGVLRGELELRRGLSVFSSLGASELKYGRLFTGRTINSPSGDTAAGNMAGAHTIRMRSLSHETGLRVRFDAGRVHHDMVLAYNYTSRKEDRSPDGVATPFPASNIYNPGPGVTPAGGSPGFSNMRRRVAEANDSLVLADTLSMADDRVQLTVGARLQRVKTTNFNATTGNASSHYDRDAVTPMVGLVVKPSPGLSLYANYIEGLQQGPTAPADASNAGEVFSPYSTEQYEIGAKQDFGQLAVTVSLYQIAQPSAYRNPVTTFFGLDGEQRHRGLDFNLFGQVSPGLRLLGGVAYINSTLRNTQGGVNDGNSGLGVPRWRAVFGVEWDTPFAPGLTLTGRVVRNGHAWLDAANTQSIPSWTRLDLGARYQVNDAFTLRLSIENALDRNDWATGGESELILSAPRSFKIAGTYRF